MNFWTGVDHGEEVHDQQHHSTKNLHKMVWNLDLFWYSAKEERKSYFIFFGIQLWVVWLLS